MPRDPSPTAFTTTTTMIAIASHSSATRGGYPNLAKPAKHPLRRGARALLFDRAASPCSSPFDAASIGNQPRQRSS